MGYGDALMAAGAAERLYASDPSLGPVVITTHENRPRWHALWQDNPAIFCPTIQAPDDARRLCFGGDHLPYYRPSHSAGVNTLHHPEWRAVDHRPSLYLTPAEQAWAYGIQQSYGPFILVEPTGKDRKNRNRCWPAVSWRRLVDLLRPLTILQLDRAQADRITSIPGIPHANFREAAALLAQSVLAILPEGGLAHAAGALRHPAVVLWGGNSDATVMSYPEHVNLVDDDPRTPCGQLFPCDHCAAAWAKLTPAAVFAAVQLALEAPACLSSR